jgi:nitroreductase
MPKNYNSRYDATTVRAVKSIVQRPGSAREAGAGVRMSISLTPARMSDSLASVFGALVEQRRSVYAYLDISVPRSVLEGAIALAMLAPNHYRTRPWRFHVYADDGRAPLAAAYETAARRLDRDVAKARQRAMDAPVMIVVACIPSLGVPRVKLGEEEFATACAVQNLLLALTSAGIASLITTGDLAESQEVHDLIGLDRATGRVMAVVNAGYRDPARPLPPRAEPDLAATTTWHMA